MKRILKRFHTGRAIFSLVIIICCIFILAVLKIAASVILPFVIAVLLAFVMYPLVKLLDKFKIPRFLSIFIAVFLIVAGLYAFGAVIFTSGVSFLSFVSQSEERFTIIYKNIADIFDLPFDEDLSIGANLWSQLGIRSWVMNAGNSLANSLLKFVSNAILVTFFMVFILLESSYFKEKLERAFKRKSIQINRMGHDLMYQVTKYLTAKFFISLANGLIFAVSFKLIGLEFAIVWGILQFIFNFIPTLGSIVMGVGISLFALVQFWPNPAPIILVIVVVLAVNMILGNILDPKIIGEHVGISPLMVLVALAIWGYIWGFAGMVIAVPMTVIIKIVCENIPILRPVAVMIGTRRSICAMEADQEAQETPEAQELQELQETQETPKA
jgi:predicted PurR-regulated permease PerM